MPRLAVKEAASDKWSGAVTYTTGLKKAGTGRYEARDRGMRPDWTGLRPSAWPTGLSDYHQIEQDIDRLTVFCFQTTN